MPDRRPPRTVTGERATLVGLLQFQRESLVRKVIGVGDEDARRSPVGSGTSLLWLVKHLTWAELSWFLVRFAGEDVTLPDEEVREGDTLREAIDAYEAAWQRVAPVLTDGDLEAMLARDDGQPRCNLRFVIGHMLEETARHAGHADILRELIDGSTGR
ncbi:DinB family protein [Actinoplanes sp. CA-142083]|uniref:DinB family protein n=1 Tax=Actinoplanes sp. CA-142083 TaxID=3239903 RepID=UPI003D9261D6